MAKRLPKAFSLASFRTIWRESRDGRGYRPGGAGVDGVTAERFASHLSAHLASIRSMIAEGQYSFSPLRPHLLPKGDDSYRVLAIPTVQDRLVQRAILEHLNADSRVNLDTPISFGFRRGFGIRSVKNGKAFD